MVYTERLRIHQKKWKKNKRWVFFTGSGLAQESSIVWLPLDPCTGVSFCTNLLTVWRPTQSPTLHFSEHPLPSKEWQWQSVWRYSKWVDCIVVGLTCIGDQPVLHFLGFEPETYWDRMQFFQEAILYRLVLFTVICSMLFSWTNNMPSLQWLKAWCCRREQWGCGCPRTMIHLHKFSPDEEHFITFIINDGVIWECV